jgi:hypothetical protein
MQAGMGSQKPRNGLRPLSRAEKEATVKSDGRKFRLSKKSEW